MSTTSRADFLEFAKTAKDRRPVTIHLRGELRLEVDGSRVDGKLPGAGPHGAPGARYRLGVTELKVPGTLSSTSAVEATGGGAVAAASWGRCEFPAAVLSVRLERAADAAPALALAVGDHVATARIRERTADSDLDVREATVVP